MSIIKLALSTAEEFARRLLKGAPHLSGHQMNSLQSLHRQSTAAVASRAAGKLENAASNLAYAKSTAGYLRSDVPGNTIKDQVGKIKETMGNKFKTTSVSVAP